MYPCLPGDQGKGLPNVLEREPAFYRVQREGSVEEEGKEYPSELEIFIGAKKSRNKSSITNSRSISLFQSLFAISEFLFCNEEVLTDRS